MIDSLNRNCDKPRLIEALKTKRIRDIACGSSHSAAITSSGELYSWGLGEYGRLGHGDNTTQLRPKLVRLHLLSYVLSTGMVMRLRSTVTEILQCNFTANTLSPAAQKNKNKTHMYITVPDSTVGISS